MHWRPRKHRRRPLPVRLEEFRLEATPKPGWNRFIRISATDGMLGNPDVLTDIQRDDVKATIEARLSNGATVRVESSVAGEVRGNLSGKGFESDLEPASAEQLIQAVRDPGVQSLDQAARSFFDVIQGLPETIDHPGLLTPPPRALERLSSKVVRVSRSLGLTWSLAPVAVAGNDLRIVAVSGLASVWAYEAAKAAKEGFALAHEDQAYQRAIEELVPERPSTDTPPRRRGSRATSRPRNLSHGSRVTGGGPSRSPRRSGRDG